MKNIYGVSIDKKRFTVKCSKCKQGLWNTTRKKAKKFIKQHMQHADSFEQIKLTHV